MKVAITGGAGYIGSTLVKKLVDDGASVVSIDNLVNGDYGHLRGVQTDESVDLREGDIRDGGLLEELFDGSDAIAHLAAIPGLVKCRDSPEEAISVNVYGTHRVLETARKLDIGKVVFCSSAAVYGKPVVMPVRESHPLRPLNLYGVTKLAGEKLMETYFDNYGLETISLRFGNVYGVGLYTNYETVIPKFVRMGLNDEELTVYGNGTSSRDYVHVEDIVQAITRAMNSRGKGGEAFNVGGETVLIDTLAEQVSESLKEATGRGAQITHLPPRPGETKNFSYNLEKIERSLDYRPRWGVKKGIEQVIKYALKQAHD
jgi:UDP-glucose 4-epimerase